MKDSSNKQRIVMLALLTAWLLLACLAAEHTQVSVKKPHADLMLRAACQAEQAFAALKEERLARGYAIDPLEDPNETGLVGAEFTEITTSHGILEAKRSTANPNTAAMIADLLVQCGVSEGDAVCLNLSGSFPCLNIAAQCALDALGARGIGIHSVGASTYGANLPGFCYADMEHVLLSRGLISNHCRWFSLGGGGDTGGGMWDDGRIAEILERASQYGLTYLSYPDFSENLAAREEIYLSEAGGAAKIRCFINIGGNLLGFGAGDGLIEAGSGILLPGTETAGNQGLVPWALSQGIPVIHLLNMNSLLPENGLPYDPIPLPAAGEGDVYYTTSRNLPLLLVFCAGTVLILFWFFLRFPRAKHPL